MEQSERRSETKILVDMGVNMSSLDITLLKKYRDTLQALGHEPVRLPSDKIPENDFDALNHVMLSCDKIIEKLEDGMITKTEARNGLYFIMGVLWRCGIYDMDQFSEDKWGNER